MTVSRAFEKRIINAESQNHKPPNLLYTDKGSQFENKHFKNLLNNLNITMCHTQNLEKSAIIERFNGTLNRKMRIQFKARNSKKRIDILRNLLDGYNFKDKQIYWNDTGQSK